MGLIRVGEMLSGISETILNPTRTATSYNASNAWIVSNDGRAGGYDVTNSFGVRPVISAKSTNTILGGNGTPNSPYEI